MDFNFPRRRREISIAIEIALASFGVIDGDNSLIAAQTRLIEQVNIACEKHQLNEAAAHRVMGYLDKEIDRMSREVADANNLVTTVNSALAAVIGRAPVMRAI